jgi:hypothetical protein
VDFNKTHKPQGCESLILNIYNQQNWWVLNKIRGISESDNRKLIEFE